MPRNPLHEPLYAAFALFCERCLLADRSLLWPEREIWTIATLEELRRRFVEGFLQGRMPFRAKLEAQLSGAPPEAWALVADCFYVYGLPPRATLPRTKLGWARWAAAQAGLALPSGLEARYALATARRISAAENPAGGSETGGEEDEAALLWQALQTGFASTGQKYNLKHAQLRLLILLALEVKAAPNRADLLRSPADLQALIDRILEEIPLKLDRANDMRSAILYLAFPDLYEPLLSNQEKAGVLRYYAPRLGLDQSALSADRDAALRQVRQALEPRFAEAGLGRPFDFSLDLREEWKPAAGPEFSPERAGLRERPAPGAGYSAAEGWPAPDPDLLRVLAALRLSKNLILYGPPGTGKTYIAQRAARSLAGPERVTWITLHSSYSYEDFIEGLRPVLRRSAAQSAPEEPPAEEAQAAPQSPKDALVHYEVRQGVFREVAARAARDPGHTYVLVIDEINRANLTRLLGELITLIEDDKRGVVSARLPYSGTRFSVPPNLVLLGTMNTADRSVALLDAALRRRFAFVEILPRADLLAGAVVETEEAVLRLDDLLTCLNAALRRHLTRDQQVGHSYFLRVAQAPPDERLALLELVWNNQVLPLLEEYFYTRRARLAEVLAPFFDETHASPPYAPPDPGAAARLSGEDLLVALSRMCDGSDEEA